MNCEALEKLGYEEYFQKESIDPLENGFFPGRVIEVGKTAMWCQTAGVRYPRNFPVDSSLRWMSQLIIQRLAIGSRFK